MEKAGCLEALQAEHTRKGKPLDKKQYDGESAVQEVARKFGQPTNQATSSDFKIVFKDGTWEITMVPQGQEEARSAPLPPLHPNGVGYWYLVKEEGELCVTNAPDIAGQTVKAQDFFRARMPVEDESDDQEEEEEAPAEDDEQEEPSQSNLGGVG